MLRGYRGIITTLAGLAIVGAALWALIVDLSSVDSAYSHAAADASVEYERDAQTYIREHCVPTARLQEVDCSAKAHEAAREGQRKEQDLAAQSITAWWTKVMGIAALIGMALSAIGVWLVKTTFEETRAGNVIARDAQRAWVILETEPVLVSPRGEGGLYVRVNFTAKNLGQTAATDFEFLHEIIFHRDKEDAESVDRRCVAQIENWVTEIGDMSESTLPPGANEKSSIWQQYDASKIHWFAQIPGGPVFTEITLLSAVFYRTTSHPEWLQCSWRTWFLCTVNREGVTILRIPKGVEFAADAMRIEPFRTALAHTQRTANHGTRHH